MGTYSPKIPKKRSSDELDFWVSEASRRLSVKDQQRVLLNRQIPIQRKMNLWIDLFSPLGFLLFCGGILLAVLLAFLQLLF